MLNLPNAYTWLQSFSDRSDSLLSVVLSEGHGKRRAERGHLYLKNVWSSVSWIKHILPASSILSPIVLATLRSVSFRKCNLYWHYWWFDNGVAKVICGAKQDSLELICGQELLASNTGVGNLGAAVLAFDDVVCANLINDVYYGGVGNLGAAVLAFDDVVCANLINDVYYGTRCTHTKPHVKSGLQWLGDYTVLRCGCPFCSYLVFLRGGENELLR